MRRYNIQHPDSLNAQRSTLIGCSDCDAIALSSYFSPADLSSPVPYKLHTSTKKLLESCARSLKIGGLLFVYGAPHHLPMYAELLDMLGDDNWRLEFKYWIAVQLHEPKKEEILQSTHVGIFLFHKVARKRYTRFHLNQVRIPHEFCPACGQNVKDWGGKKHLMNPQGAALSDVWTDLPIQSLTDHVIPEDVLIRLQALCPGSFIHIIEPPQEMNSDRSTLNAQRSTSPGISGLPTDRVETADCIEFMESLLLKYEHNAFDLIFADPPYNLAKLYTNYTDSQAAEEYLAWCDKWLKLCSRLLKPGGSMYVLNLPKWALYHSRTLDKLLDFRRWIAWRALAEPRGKLLPAHYALLYYTKPGAPPVFNSDLCETDSPEYCLRASCIKKRKAAGDDRKAPLTDIWCDIYRIRHKRDRDYHPCQLPEKLLERIILLSSNPGQVIFDPFCGVGTTAVVAKRLNRHFITTDIDPEYIRITKTKLKQ